jgi:thymidylate kinase
MEVNDNLFFERVRSGYLELAKNEARFRVIDGTQSIERIHQQILIEIKSIENKEQ